MKYGMIGPLYLLATIQAYAGEIPTNIGHTTCRTYTTAANSFFGEKSEVDALFQDATTWLKGYVLSTGSSPGSHIDNLRKSKGNEPVMIMEWAVDYCKDHPDKYIEDAGDYMLYQNTPGNGDWLDNHGSPVDPTSSTPQGPSDGDLMYELVILTMLKGKPSPVLSNMKVDSTSNAPIAKLTKEQCLEDEDFLNSLDTRMITLTGNLKNNEEGKPILYRIYSCMALK